MNGVIITSGPEKNEVLGIDYPNSPLDFRVL
jgi:hypothetical protein